MIIAATGHRPQRLGGFGEDIYEKLLKLALNYLREKKPDKTISGMALGWDQAWADASVLLNIPFIAAVPFKEQPNKWPVASVVRYQRLLDRAASVEVFGDTYAPYLMQVRNRWMVDNCDRLCALYDGNRIGGTGDTIAHARRNHVPIDNLWNLYVR